MSAAVVHRTMSLMVDTLQKPRQKLLSLLLMTTSPSDITICLAPLKWGAKYYEKTIKNMDL